MLRSRTSRREESVTEHLPEPVASRHAGNDPEREAPLEDSVGMALLVTRGRLAPAERLAFVTGSKLRCLACSTMRCALPRESPEQE